MGMQHHWFNHSVRMVVMSICIALMCLGMMPRQASALPVLNGPRSFILTHKNEILRLAANVIESGVAVKNLKQGEQLLGIDFRPATGRMYGLGSTNQLYVIDHLTGVASPIGAPFSTALEGTEFGFDFNPAVDRIRIVSDSGQNLRVHPDTGAVAAVDGRLAYAPSDPMAGQTPMVVGAAYTNPDTNPNTATTLYGIDTASDTLVKQDPPNDGTLNKVGHLGVSVNKLAGFDIAPYADNLGLVKNNVGLAVLKNTDTGRATLYRIDINTGKATSNGEIQPTVNVRGITIPLAVPAASQVYALTTANTLLGFDALVPTLVKSRQTVTGLVAGERLVGIDFRPATGRMYGLGSTSQLYVLDHLTGVASPIGAPFSTALEGTEFGFDFNPAVDRIRIVSDSGQNLRVHPDTGAVAAVDGRLAYAPSDPMAGQTPMVVGAAYTNPDTNPNTVTTLYGIDAAQGTLVKQDPPNDGTLNKVGHLGVSATAVTGFDIGPVVTGPLGLFSGAKAIAVLQNGPLKQSKVFSIDLTTGRVTLHGVVPTQDPMLGIAINLDLYRK